MMRRKNYGLALPLLIILIFLAPSPAYAYLDPGSGNVLLYLAISLFGVMAYSVKNIFWTIFGKKRDGLNQSNPQISILSEGRNYWSTFRPIVMALIDMKCPFSYYSMDIDDPGLTIEDELMNSTYIGDGAAAFARVGLARHKVMLATTPNIGTPGFPIERPKLVEKLVHVCHSVDAVPWYKKGSIDHYDAILLSGKFMEYGIRCLEERRGLKAKELIPAGVPYLDELALKIKRPLPPTNGNTILVAPSWGDKGCLSVYGENFIKDLARAKFNVIIRPHPQSWKSEKKLLDRVKAELEAFDGVEWDDEPDGSLSMERADILVSDTSNVRFDFALLYGRPVITLKISPSHLDTFELSDMDHIWSYKAEREIGAVIDSDMISDIAAIARDILEGADAQDMALFRDKNIYNFENSGKVIATYLSGFIEESSA
jgi:hypothetical protein